MSLYSVASNAQERKIHLSCIVYMSYYRYCFSLYWNIVNVLELAVFLMVLDEQNSMQSN